MTWPDSDKETTTTLKIISAANKENNNNIVANSKGYKNRTIVCPSCGHAIKLQDQAGLQNLPGLPAGVKFDPSDQEILQHLEAKVLSDKRKLHPLIDEFIPTIEGENGICYTHPEKLPGVSKEGQIRHFFHRPSKAYTTGTRKRRKVHTDDDDEGETRWHKTGKTRPISALSGTINGYKKILVLYTNYGRQKKPEKTNWVMHQYHLGDNEDEKDGELVVSKVFYQTQPRQCAKEGRFGKLRGSTNNKASNEGTLVKNNAGFVEYYDHQPFISYGPNVEGEGPPPLISNMVVHGGGPSFLQPRAN